MKVHVLNHYRNLKSYKNKQTINKKIEFANALQNPIDYVKSLDKKDELLRRLQDDEVFIS